MALYNKFQEQLKQGQKYEMKLLDYVKYDNYKQSQGYFKEYDMEITYKENKKTYEVKKDWMIYRTGNICIEYECYNKPSGIKASKAKYWAIFEVIDDNNCVLYLIKRKLLLKMIENKEYKYIRQGGDNNASKMYLFDKKLFTDYIKKPKQIKNI